MPAPEEKAGAARSSAIKWRSLRGAGSQSAPAIRCSYIAARLRELADQQAEGNAVRAGQLDFLARNLRQLPPQRVFGFAQFVLRIVANKYRQAGQPETAGRVAAIQTTSRHFEVGPRKLEALRELQPGTRRVSVHASRRNARDGDLLLAERIGANTLGRGLRTWLLQNERLLMNGHVRIGERLRWLANLMEGTNENELERCFPGDPPLALPNSA